MPRKVYYGSYQSQRNRSNKKKVLITVALIVAAAGFITAVCVISFNKNGYGAAMQNSVEEMTQMRIRIKELEDQVISLQNEIEGYKAELAMRPATTAAPIEPPNDSVAAMQATPEPTPTPKTKSTKKPSIPTQPPTQPPQQDVPVIDNPLQNVQENTDADISNIPSDTEQ